MLFLHLSKFFRFLLIFSRTYSLTFYYENFQTYGKIERMVQWTPIYLPGFYNSYYFLYLLYYISSHQFIYPPILVFVVFQNELQTLVHFTPKHLHCVYHLLDRVKNVLALFKKQKQTKKPWALCFRDIVGTQSLWAFPYEIVRYFKKKCKPPMLKNTCASLMRNRNL